MKSFAELSRKQNPSRGTRAFSGNKIHKNTYQMDRKMAQKGFDRDSLPDKICIKMECMCWTILTYLCISCHANYLCHSHFGSF